MGKPRSKESEYIERQLAAANARKAMLEKFRAKTAEPAAPQPQAEVDAPDRGVAGKVAETKAKSKAKTMAPQPEHKTTPAPRDTGKAKSKTNPGTKKDSR